MEKYACFLSMLELSVIFFRELITVFQYLFTEKSIIYFLVIIGNNVGSRAGYGD
jgi:hypothetical protein